MNKLSRAALVVLATACTSCMPTITIKNNADKTGCQYEKISKPLIEVPLDTKVAIWRVDSRCEKEAKVEVGEFKYAGAYYPIMKCHTFPAPAGGDSFILCSVNDACRQDEAYDYSVLIDSESVDPQVILKRDPPGRPRLDEAKCLPTGKVH